MDMYAYQMFGIILRNNHGLVELINEHNKKFQNLPGLIQWLSFSNVEDQIASGLFLCRDIETAERVKSIVHEVKENFDALGEYYYILNEFIFRIIDNTIYE